MGIGRRKKTEGYAGGHKMNEHLLLVLVLFLVETVTAIDTYLLVPLFFSLFFAFVTPSLYPNKKKIFIFSALENMRKKNFFFDKKMSKFSLQLNRYISAL